MKIWLINQYNMPPEYGHLNRHFNFGKYLKRMGHEPSVFVGSFLHNTKVQMIKDDSVIEKYKNADYPYYFIKTCDYSSSKLKRIYAMYEFYKNLLKAVKSLDKPDAILGSSAHPLAAVAAIKLAKKYGCQSIVEVRDLWPESFVAYGIINRKNPLLKLLYAGEKWIYKNANKLVFTMEGGRDYIIEQRWDNENCGPIDISKVYHINNGVDLEVFNYNKEHYQFEDDDLDNDIFFKVVYTGSIRKVNQLGMLVEVARELEDDNILFLIWGDGDEKEVLTKRCKEEGIKNIVFKGFADKKYIPSILSRADINLIHGGYTSIMEYGMSANKMFDYIAAQKPILSDLKTNYDIIKKYKLGLVIENQNYKDICNGILELRNDSEENKAIINENLEKALKEFSFDGLTNKLVSLLSMEGKN